MCFHFTQIFLTLSSFLFFVHSYDKSLCTEVWRHLVSFALDLSVTHPLMPTVATSNNICFVFATPAREAHGTVKQ